MKFKREFLKQKREEKKFNLRELSEKSGVSTSYIHILENEEETKVSALKLYKLAKALDVKMESFFENVEKKENPYLICYRAMTRKGFKIFGNSAYSISKLTERELENITNDILREEKDLFSLVIINIIKLEE